MGFLRQRHNRQGFTLVEIMAVTAIIGMITAMAMPHFMRTRVNTNEAAAQANLKTLFDLTEDYRFVNGVYPPGSSEIAAFASATYGGHPIVSNPNEDGSFVFQGYRFLYWGGGLQGADYDWTAFPTVVNVTGERSFRMDESSLAWEVTYDQATSIFGSTGGETSEVGPGDADDEESSETGEGVGDVNAHFTF